MKKLLIFLFLAACNNSTDSDNLIRDYVETPKEQAVEAAENVESKIKDVHDQFKELEDY